MNSFKKIALVLVATMTMGTISVIPANAAVSTTLKVGSSTVATGTVSTNPTLIPVPADNSVDSGDALQIAITGLDTGTSVTATVNGGKVVAALATPTVPVTAAGGSSSLVLNTGTGTTADFFIFTTSTNAGTVSVSIGGNITTYYFKGTVGALNSITLTAPVSAASGTTEKVTVAGYDVFGNPRGGSTINLQVVTTTSTTTALLTESATTDTTVLGAKTVDVAIPATGNVTLVATASVASAVTGLAVPVGVVIKTINVRDLLGELAAVKAELAAEKSGRAADKVAADTAAAKAAADLITANAEIAKLKAEAVTAKITSDKAFADAKAMSDKALADLSAQVASLTAEITSLTKALDALKKKYNAMAKKYKFKPVA